MNEILFLVQESPDGGYEAKALTAPIFTGSGNAGGTADDDTRCGGLPLRGRQPPGHHSVAFCSGRNHRDVTAMPRLPRDLAGAELIRALSRYGYSVTRQTGSHVRLTRINDGIEQHLTIPRHATLRVGTLHSILSEVAQQLGKGKEDLLQEPLRMNLSAGSRPRRHPSPHPRPGGHVGRGVENKEQLTAGERAVYT